MVEFLQSYAIWIFLGLFLLLMLRGRGCEWVVVWVVISMSMMITRKEKQTKVALVIATAHPGAIRPDFWEVEHGGCC